MRSLDFNVTATGITPNTADVGNAGEHNVTCLRFSLSEDILAAVEYYRISIGDFRSERLYAEGSVVSYSLPQSVLQAGTVLLQLDGYKTQGDEIILIFKSGLVSAEVGASVCPSTDIPSELKEPYESAFTELRTLVEQGEKISEETTENRTVAEKSAESAENYMESAKTDAEQAERSAQAADSCASAAASEAIGAQNSALTAGLEAQKAADFAAKAEMHSSNASKQAATVEALTEQTESYKNAAAASAQAAAESAYRLNTFGDNNKILDYIKYEITDNTVTITDCDESISGVHVIPDTIACYPVTKIDNSAFFDCGNLANITIPDSITSIGSSAFAYCTNLTNITIPDSVTMVGNRAFFNCSSLTAITIPDSVTSIDEYTFASCTNLTDVYYKGTKEQWDAISVGVDNDKLINATLHYKYGDVPTPENDGDAINKAYIDTELGELKENIYTKDEVYSKEETDTLLKSKADKNKILDYIKYEISNNEVTITDCDESISGAYVIPDTIEGYPVTSIGDRAFNECAKLTNITIPSSITSIGINVFHGCTSLTSITIPDSVTSIGTETFAYCTSLTSITIGEGVTSINMSAFHNCTSLTSITIPDGVTMISPYAFYNCSSLTSITIPDGVTMISPYAFYNCSSLTDVYYKGTKEQWDAINIGEYNENLTTNATLHYKYGDVPTPTNDGDAVNKAYLDTELGNVETALDGIIAIQEELIGGETE